MQPYVGPSCASGNPVMFVVEVAICVKKFTDGPRTPRDCISSWNELKVKIGINIPQGTCKWIASFQLKRLKVKVTGRKKNFHSNLASVYLWVAAQAPTAN